MPGRAPRGVGDEGVAHKKGGSWTTLDRRISLATFPAGSKVPFRLVFLSALPRPPPGPLDRSVITCRPHPTQAIDTPTRNHIDTPKNIVDSSVAPRRARLLLWREQKAGLLSYHTSHAHPF